MIPFRMIRKTKMNSIPMENCMVGISVVVVAVMIFDRLHCGDQCLIRFY